MGDFQKFNRGARAVLVRARDEAIPRDHRFIAPEHLLLGMVRERKGLAAKALHNLNLPVSALVLALDYSLDHFKRPEAGDISLSSRSKRVLWLAVEERRSLRHDQIGTAHLLLGLCCDEELASKGILQGLGMDRSAVRADVLRLIDKYGPERTSRFWSMTDPVAHPSVARVVGRVAGRRDVP